MSPNIICVAVNFGTQLGIFIKRVDHLIEDLCRCGSDLRTAEVEYYSLQHDLLPDFELQLFLFRNVITWIKRIGTSCHFYAVTDRASVCIDLQRVGLVVLDFVPVSKSVTVGIGFERIGPVAHNLLLISQSVAL